jgi:hypothetical protein
MTGSVFWHNTVTQPAEGRRLPARSASPKPQAFILGFQPLNLPLQTSDLFRIDFLRHAPD